MIPWETLRPVVFDWVKYGLGLEQVVLEDEERPYTMDVWGRISLGEVQGIGTDVIRYDQSGDGNLVPTVMGLRILTFNVSVESLHQGWDQHAAGPVERMRSLAHLPLQHRRLHGVDLALVDVSQSVPANIEVDQRVLSGRVCQVRMNLAINHLVTDDAAQESWIRSVGITAHVKTESGQEVPATPEEETISLDDPPP